MCILSYLPADVEIDREGLENGGLSNPDGHGWAIVVPGTDEILIGKSLSLDEALSTFEAARKANPSGPALFHSRWATHGSVKPDNCHPFYVGGSNRTVVAHNGILPSAAHPGKDDDRSDTRLFADEILCTRYRRLDKPRAFNALTEFCGRGNKLVILTTDPRYRENAYLVNQTAGNWDKSTGLWHSNYDYRWSTKSYGMYGSTATTVGSYRWWDDEHPSMGYFEYDAKTNSRRWVPGREYAAQQALTVGKSAAESAAVFTAAEQADNVVDDECLFCYYGRIDKYGYCDECSSCQDCLESMESCQCYHKVDAALADDEYLIG